VLPCVIATSSTTAAAPPLQVAVPHFKRSQSSADDESRNRLAQLPRRCTGDSIMAGMQAEAAKAWRAPAPVPAGTTM
jgi:hypothetical protein